MWKPGQLVTICGEVYRIKRVPAWLIRNPCVFCSFYHKGADYCELRLYEPKYKDCLKLIPVNCYFDRLCIKQDN